MTKFYSIFAIAATTIFVVGLIIGVIGSVNEKPRLDKAGIILALCSFGLMVIELLIFAWYSVLNM